MKKLISFFLLISISYIYSQNGANWTEQNSGVSVRLTGVSVLRFNINNVWICGDNGTVLKTSDGGTHWQNVSSNLPANIQFTTICNTNNFVLTAGNIGSNTFTYLTSDGGLSWQQVFGQSSGKINSIGITQYLSNTECFMIGEPVGGRWSIWKSSDFGMTWDSTNHYLPQSGVEEGFNNSFCIKNFSGNYQMWFGTNNHGIYYSGNSGQTWVSKVTTEQNSYCVYVDGYSSTAQSFLEGFIGGDNLLRTSDAGSFWLNVPSEGTGPINAITSCSLIGVIPTDNYSFQRLWYIRNNKIYFTGNNGSSWSNEYTSPRGNYTHMSDGSENTTIWAVRDNGGISKGVILLTIVEPPVNYPHSFKLMQNYPNPFNPVTTIAFEIYKATRIKLSIYDLKGELVETLIDGEYNSGLMIPGGNYIQNKVTWEGKNYGSGVYFYKITADDYTETKKMMLIK